jgi:hypothetical protein
MAAVANNPSFAKKVGVPQSVGKDFSNADKGRKFSKGGDMKSDMMKKGMPAALAKHAAKPASKAHAGLKAGGGVTRADGCVTKGHTKGKQISMKSGGMAC